MGTQLFVCFQNRHLLFFFQKDGFSWTVTLKNPLGTTFGYLQQVISDQYLKLEISDANSEFVKVFQPFTQAGCPVGFGFNYDTIPSVGVCAPCVSGFYNLENDIT